MGVILTTEALYPQIRGFYKQIGLTVSPDDAYLALRGLRTLAVRLERHQRNAQQVAQWLSKQPEVEQVLYPALPDAPGHALWKRDFTGACGLFAVQLRPMAEQAVTAMLDGMNLFGMGFSWGGFESLILLTNPGKDRTAKPWQGRGPLLRLHIGLENPEDLIADLEAGFERMRSELGAVCAK